MVCKTAYFIPVFIHRAYAIMRVFVVPGKLILLIGKDTLKVLEARFDLKNNIGIVPDAGDLQGNVLGESRAGHLMVPLLPDSSWEFHDSFLPSGTAGPLVFSTNVTNEAFSVKPLQGSRTIRDLVISFGKGSFQRLHRTFRRLRQKRTTASEHDSQVEKEVMENVFDGCGRLLHWRPRESDVMDVEESLHQKPRDACIAEDTATIDLGCFENTKLNRVKNGTRCLLQIGVRDWESLGASPSMIQQGFC